MGQTKRSICELPFHIYFAENDDAKGTRAGRLIHVEEPRFECRFHIDDTPLETKGFSTHNIQTGVQLYDVTLPKGQDLTANIKEITAWMKEGAGFLYNILYLPYFRK